MATYMIFIREGEVVDAAAMAAYQSGNSASAPVAGLKPLVVYGEMETLEGDAAEGIVILQFPDKAAAKAWYESPEYQARIPHRQKAAPYRAFMVEGF